MTGIGLPLISFGAILILVAVIASRGRSRGSASRSRVSGPVGLIVLIVGVLVYLIEEGYLVTSS